VEKGIFAAWALGMGLLTWRELQLAPWKPPPPGRYLAASGLYAVLGLVGTSDAAAPLAAAVAWAFDVALVLQVLPETMGGPVKQQTTTQAGAKA
jgi:hypothetical protein